MHNYTSCVSHTVWGIKRRKLSSVPRVEQNLGDQKFRVDREMEATVTPDILPRHYKCLSCCDDYVE
jgi:hypothetical protein